MSVLLVRVAVLTTTEPSSPALVAIQYSSADSANENVDPEVFVAARARHAACPAPCGRG